MEQFQVETLVFYSVIYLFYFYFRNRTSQRLITVSEKKEEIDSLLNKTIIASEITFSLT